MAKQCAFLVVTSVRACFGDGPPGRATSIKMAHQRFALEARKERMQGLGMMGWFGFRPGYAPSSSAEVEGVCGRHRKIM